MKYLAFLTIATFVFASQSCYYDNEEDLYQFFNTSDCDTTNVTYNNQVVAVLNQSCIVCHSTEAAPDNGGGLDISTFEKTKIYAENGSLYGSIIHDSSYESMPPSVGKIPQCDQDIIRIWIREGMPEK
jgi:hypothetical protein